MKASSSLFASLFCAALMGLVGCSSTDAATQPSTDVTSTESNLISTDSSLENSQQQAQDCITTFKACKASGEDKALCAEQLKACLPDAPAKPTKCSGADEGGEGKGGKKGPPPVGEDGKPLPPPDGGKAPPVGEDGKPLPPPDGEAPPVGEDGKPLPPPDGGKAPPVGEDGKPLPPPDGDKPDCDKDGGAEGDGQAAGGPGAPPPPPPGAPGGKGGKPGGKGGSCSAPPIAPEDIKGCHEKLCSAADGEEDAALEEHKGCMKKAFGKHKKPLCDQGTEACSASDASADQCTKIAQHCADAE